MLNQLILKIKRRENFFFAFMYDVAKSARTFGIPTIKTLHLPLYYVDRGVRAGFRWFANVFWNIPLFRARCESVGANLHLPDGMPYIAGSHLRIVLGNQVTIGRSTIGASKVFDDPVLKIGNNTSIGYGNVISVAKEVTIGDNCMTGANCLIMDSDDHPLDPQKRLLRLPVDRADVRPVRIGNNVWLGAHCTILKGVTIGDNSIISAHAVVTSNVESNSIYAGNPARAIAKCIGGDHGIARIDKPIGDGSGDRYVPVADSRSVP